MEVPSSSTPTEHGGALNINVFVRVISVAQVLFTATLFAQELRLDLDLQKAGTPVSPTLYGLMIEEINHSIDGGLYAELVQNRAFHSDWSGTTPWDLIRKGSSQATATLDTSSGPSQVLSSSMKLSVAAASTANEAGLTNPGYWGFGLQANTTYKGSLYARVAGGSPGPVTVRLINDRTGGIQASATVTPKAGSWTQYTYTLKTKAIAPSANNHLELTVAHPGTIWLQMVSLFGPTFHDRPNGLRPDLMTMMAEMHPSFLRMPGGNFLEGNTLQDAYDWKKTIGPVLDRPGHNGPWFYWSSDGLGLLDYLTWCEDLHMEPVLAVNAGYALNGTHLNPGKDLEPLVQSALDEVEYVTGNASTHWGGIRSRDGHPAPFVLHYIEVGNEDYLDKSGSYPARYAQFAAALHRRYPQYKLIATDGNTDYTTRVANPEISDEHYYKSPSDMMDLVHHYDSAPRTGPKIFVGEWATRSGTPTPNFGDALGDAAWMTSLERNSDLIVMAAYAPLFTNVNPGAMIWPTDLIGYDATHAYGSPSYYAQSLFAAHLGDTTIPASLSRQDDRFFYSATRDTKAGTVHLKLVNAHSTPETLTIAGFDGPRKAQAFRLHAATWNDTNSIADPTHILPTASTFSISGRGWSHTIEANTIEVIDIPSR